jgi:hypothetical protein
MRSVCSRDIPYRSGRLLPDHFHIYPQKDVLIPGIPRLYPTL